MILIKRMHAVPEPAKDNAVQQFRSTIVCLAPETADCCSESTNPNSSIMMESTLGVVELTNVSTQSLVQCSQNVGWQGSATIVPTIHDLLQSCSPSSCDYNAVSLIVSELMLIELCGAHKPTLETSFHDER